MTRSLPRLYNTWSPMVRIEQPVPSLQRGQAQHLLGERTPLTHIPLTFQIPPIVQPFSLFLSPVGTLYLGCLQARLETRPVLFQIVEKKPIRSLKLRRLNTV
jgi:hypothetical protein